MNRFLNSCMSVFKSKSLTVVATFTLFFLAGFAASQEKDASSIPAASAVEAKKSPRADALVSLEHIKKYQLGKYVESSAHWEKEIGNLAAGNATQGSDESIVFLGSSSIRLWNTIDEDVEGWKVVRRGYGGAKFCDLAIYAPNLIQNLRFKGAAIFVANDIVGNNQDKTPEEVARLAKSVIESIRAEVPRAPILLISITATPSRFKAWSKIEQANQELQKLADSLELVYFLDTKETYLDEKGEPKPQFFVGDMLHQNREGYQHWGKLVREKLASIPAFRSSSPE